ncbi:band 3 anion transport protein-like [Watersipora subatra]|uniref:band 3 anion transport protein-like n=1 Tax=Watersipora subatra TaxID=2589382 RepID=UPI00355BBD59
MAEADDKSKGEGHTNSAYDSGSENGSGSSSGASHGTSSTVDISDVKPKRSSMISQHTGSISDLTEDRKRMSVQKSRSGSMDDQTVVKMRRGSPPTFSEATSADGEKRVSIFINDKEFKAAARVNYRRNSLWYLPKKMEGDDWNVGERRPESHCLSSDYQEDHKLTICNTNGAVDRSPHQLFVELDELSTEFHEDDVELWEWKEKARWIKFEEDALNSSDRWGRPHVASLSFQSLIHLHKALENGIIFLDMVVQNGYDMMHQVVNVLLERGQLSKRNEDYLKNALLLRHSHSTGRAKYMKADKSNSQFLLASSANRGAEPIDASESKDFSIAMDNHQVLMQRINSLKEDQSDRQYNFELLKKIPKGAEVASVLVGTMKDLEKPCVAFIRLSKGEMLDHISEVPLPVRFMFICVGPPIEHMDYVEIGRSLSTLMANQRFHDAVYEALDRPAILAAMNEFLDESMVLPPGDFDSNTLLPIMHMAQQKLKEKEAKKKAEQEAKRLASSSLSIESGIEEEEKDPLKRTGRPFGGLITDIRCRYPKYLSDIKDGFSMQALAALIFIYFAAVSPAITFGGLLDEKTDSYIGASELLLATTIGGVVFSLLAGQPLLIVGFTGPLLVFEEGVYTISNSLGIDYLSWRLWIGVWICIIATVHVAVEASFLVRFVSRFTQEIFAFLISLIFIYETFAKLVYVFKEHPMCWNYEDCLEKTGREFSYLPHIGPYNDSTVSPNGTVTVPSIIDIDLLVQPNTALLSMTLTLATFALAYYFKGLRNAKILGRTVRRALGDFGVPIALFIMVLLDYLIGDDVYTQKLSVPSTFSPTSPEKRGWFINPMGAEKPLPVGHIFSAAIPALVGAILIFLETLITGMIVNKKEHKLIKGTGFHLDILLMGVFGLVNGFMALPFVTCATVRSVAHTSALTVISKNNAPGEQPKLEKVIEQRVTNFGVHVLIGASMFLGMVLKYIPIATLFGVFLYMGVASLGGIQLYQRIVLLITPTKHHPMDVGYIRYVRLLKMHLFTGVQILCVAVLWAVKSSPAALAFPFVLILLVPFRSFLLPRIFTEQELKELDKADSSSINARDKAGEEDEPDFYEQAYMAS